MPWGFKGMDDLERHRVEVNEELSTRLAQVRHRERLLGLRKREWVVLGIFLLLALAAHINFQRVVVKGHSMDPTFHNGESLVVWKLAPRDRLKAGDVIVFRQGSDDLIKRIVYITPIQEATAFPPPHFPPVLDQPNPNAPSFLWYFLKVQLGYLPRPPLGNTIYVMGDNFAISDDSRHFGPINPSQILGRVLP